MLRVAGLVLASVALAAAVPSQIHSDEAVDRLLAADPTDYAEMEIPALPHFNIPLGVEFDEDAFENLNFIVMSEGAAAKQQEPDAGVVEVQAEDPIVCETICRPMSEAEENPLQAVPEEQAAGPTPPEATGTPVNGPAGAGAADAAAGADADVTAMMLLDVGKQLCEAK